MGGSIPQLPGAVKMALRTRRQAAGKPAPSRL